MVQVSGGALARTSSVAPSIKIKSTFRGNRVDTIFEQGLRPALFFWSGACALLDRIIVAIDAVGDQRAARDDLILVEPDRIPPDHLGSVPLFHLNGG